MDAQIDVKPLPYKTRQRTFGLLLVVFLASLPFLYLYATGYRFDLQKPTNLVSTGGIYLAVDRTGAEIFIDNELVRETRTFRKAFYAQSLDVGTHRVHVQKDGYHTWVKELPVSKHRVTEAEAFNLPVVPQVRVISKWQTATGSMIVMQDIVNASATNPLVATTTTATTTFLENPEFSGLLSRFASSSEEIESLTRTQQLRGLLQGQATGTLVREEATTTLTSGGVRLYQSEDDIFATWVGSFEEMPYYYCAPEFPAYSTTTKEDVLAGIAPSLDLEEEDIDTEEGIVMHPVQTIPKDIACDPAIRIDRRGQQIRDFDFFPGTTDFVLVVLEEGIYVIEIDDRSWQNAQPVMLGSNLKFHIENGNVFVYDGALIYQIILTTE